MGIPLLLFRKPDKKRSTVIPWYLTGGISLSNCVAAYQPIGAASLAASYINLVNPGTYNAAPGTAPTFNSATGWIFNGSTQYLTTGVIEANTNWSMILQFTGGSNDQGVLIGSISGGHWFIRPDSSVGNTITYRHGGNTGIQPSGLITFGNLCISKNIGYKNGVLHGTITDFSTTVSGVGLYIGACNVGGSPNFYKAATIAAVSIYNIELSSLQVAALVQRMAVLPL